MKYCSICGDKNTFSFIEGNNRYHCKKCSAIHYQNPKPTATIICLKNNKILLAKRAFEPAIGEWGLPGGFMELRETLEEAARRELKEETNLDGEVVQMLGTCSHYGTIFGDILSIAVEMKVSDFSKIKAGDDAQELNFFEFNNLPMIPFHCHNKFIKEYLEKK
ncbi:NUDIX hydrolase [bacterium]|nr:NUDIX hydrolase [bacterium]|tara:strand:+ start:4881 stop:5369 length:489 start_codon:yes stop_codon:yes gene_type:complete